MIDIFRIPASSPEDALTPVRVTDDAQRLFAASLHQMAEKVAYLIRGAIYGLSM